MAKFLSITQSHRVYIVPMALSLRDVHPLSLNNETEFGWFLWVKV